MKPLPINMQAASGLPFYRQITDQLTDLIRVGWVERGQRLPSVRDLAGQLLVSVITVRRAYAEMERTGLIECRQGSGTFVADDVTPATRARALRDARRILKEAVVVARRLGMDDGMQLALMKRLLADGEYRG
ncbi:MAG: GntR family transcriptional regulator [Planctomycetota bacterium]|nr:GntR family transcriptional regulator [Planctomycetota bacterium]